MEERFTLRCAKQHGVLARVITTLRRSGYELNSHSILDCGKTSLLTLKIESEATADQITELFTKTKGVLEIEFSDTDELVGVSTAGDSPRMFEIELVREMARKYPDISTLLNQYQRNLDRKTAPDDLHRLGKNVATRRAQTVPLSSTLGFTDVVNDYLLPELAPIAYAELSDAGLKVLSSIFTGPRPGRPKTFNTFGMSLELASVDRGRCDFLCGYIQGMLAKATWLQPRGVSEVYCRNEGQPYCLFDLG